MRALAHKLLWWRHSWFFNWAHKPLCLPYREDVLLLGRLRLCRGCTALWSGVLIAGPLLVTVVKSNALAMTFGALFAGVVVLSHPRRHSRWPRPLRDVLRIGAGSLPGLALGMSWTGDRWPGIAALALLASVYVGYAKLRAPDRLHKCASCPELGAGICSGYSVQAEAVRAWEDRASELESARRMRAS